MSLAEFEKQLKDEVTGHELAKQRMTNYYMDKEEHMKDKFGFRLEMSEVALLETKLNSRKQIDQLSMALSDAESKLFQMYKGDN